MGFSVLSTMFLTLFRSYGAGMKKIASVTNTLNLAPLNTTRPFGIVGAVGRFPLKFLKALARGYVESARCYPYWILFAPPPPRTPEPRR